MNNKKIIYLVLLLVVLFGGGYSYNSKSAQSIISVADFYTPDIQKSFGTLPIVISAPHGGNKSSFKVKNRNCKNCNLIKDAYTIELAKQIKKEIYKITGEHCSIIYTNRHRKELDLNRKRDLAYSSRYMKDVYNEYHRNIDKMLKRHEATIYLDIHGHNHSSYEMELGYNFSNYDFKNGCDHLENTWNKSSFRNFTPIGEQDVCDVLYGIDSFGSQLSNDYKVIPSVRHKFSREKYFNGGYSIEQHRQNNTYAVQIEVIKRLRFNKRKRNILARKIAVSTVNLMNRYNLNSKKKN